MRMTWLITKIAWRSLWRSPRRSVATIAAVFVGLMSCLCLSALARGMSYNLRSESLAQFTGAIQIHDSAYLADPTRYHSLKNVAEMLSQLADNPEIEAATARVRVPALIMSERASSGVTLIGVLPDKERRHSRPLQRIIEGRQMTATIEPEVVVGKALVRKLKTAIGKRLVILTEGADQEMKELGVKIVGVFDTPGTATEEGVILLALPLAQSLVDFSSSEVSEIELLTDLDKAELIAAQVQRKFPTLEVLPWQMLVPFIASLYKVQSGFLLLWFTIVGLTALSSLLNTVYMSTIERYREFGMLMAIGMNRSQLLTQVLIEVLFLLLLGIVSANCVALLVVDYFMVGIDLSLFSSALERFGVDTLLFPRIILRDWYLANSLMVVTGLVGGFFPALRAAQLKPIEAMRKV